MIELQQDGVTVYKSCLYETSSLVVRSPDAVLVVDPCWLPQEVAAIRDDVYGTLGGRELYALFTHGDFDHIIGCGAFPGAKVIASAALRDRSPAEREAALEQARAYDDEHYWTRGYPLVHPAVDIAVDADGTSITIGSMELVLYTAPGHTADGIMAVVKPHGLLIAGDYLSDAEIPLIDHDSRAYEQTLGKLDVMLASHPIGLLVPGHGSCARDRAEMVARRDGGLRYIRKLREAVNAGDRQADGALLAGCRYPRAMAQVHASNRERLEREAGRRG